MTSKCVTPTFADGAALCAGGLDVESEEHNGAVGQWHNDVTMATCCNGSIQERGSPLCSGGLDPVEVTKLQGREEKEGVRGGGGRVTNSQIEST